MVRRWSLIALVGLVLGVVAEYIQNGWDDPLSWTPDLLAGWAIIACGLAGWSGKPQSHSGPLLVATGFAWFLGNFSTLDLAPVVWFAERGRYLYVGLFAYCILSFPNGRLSSAASRGAVALAFVSLLITPLGTNQVMIALGAVIVAAAIWDLQASVGRDRWTRVFRVRVAAGFGATLVLSGWTHLALPGNFDAVLLLFYEGSMVAIAVALMLGVLRSRTNQAAMTDLVVDLAARPSDGLRDALARVLVDPSLQVAYWVAERHEYVDASGRSIDVLAVGQGYAVTPVDLDGQRVAVLLHDPVVLTDAGLRDAISAAAALTAANARLQAEVRDQVADVQASRRRLVAAGDDERRRLELRLRDGAALRLGRVAVTLAAATRVAEALDAADTVSKLERARLQLDRTLEDLYELARGLDPLAVTDGGLAGAVSELAYRSTVPVDLTVYAVGLPLELQAAAYFICSEGLSNVSKYSRASRASINLGMRDGYFVVEIHDDGVGGADLGAGSGLGGLTDRVDALGGAFRIVSPRGGGTRLTAVIPLGREARSSSSVLSPPSPKRDRGRNAQHQDLL